jgi:hypothetical protein
MNLKQLAGKVREAVKGDEEQASVPPANPARPADWDAPLPASFESVRPTRPTPEPPPRVETRPAPPREQPPREAAPRAAAPRPDIGRTSDVRLGMAPETAEAAGRAGRWKASATVPDLATVYKEAGIESPLHGYGVDKLTDMLASPHLANASREVRSTAVQVALEAARVPLRDIIDDALLRAKALAAFEADKAFDLQASQMRAERRAQVLRDQVDAFRRQKNAEIDELKRAVDATDNALAQLRARKRREEERLFRVVTHFAEARPAVSAPARPAAPRLTPPPAATSAPAAAAAPAMATAPAAASPSSAAAIAAAPGTGALAPPRPAAPLAAPPTAPASTPSAAAPGTGAPPTGLPAPGSSASSAPATSAPAPRAGATNAAPASAAATGASPGGTAASGPGAGDAGETGAGAPAKARGDR